MAIFKVVFFYNMEPQGWNEAYYWKDDTGEVTLVNDIGVLTKWRLGLLSKAVELRGIRYQQIDVAPPSGLEVAAVQRPSVYVTPKNGGLLGTLPGLSVNPWLALLTNLYDTAGFYRRSLLLRGMPTTLLAYDPAKPKVPDIPPELDIPLKSFLNYLIGRGTANQTVQSPWAILGRVKDENQRFTLPIIAIEQSTGTDRRWIIVIANNAGYIPGDVIHVHGVTGCVTRGINGDSVVEDVQNNVEDQTQTITLSKVQCCPGLVDYKGNGISYRVLKTNAVSMAKYSIGRVVKRDTGGPTGGTRGRRRKACCR